MVRECDACQYKREKFEDKVTYIDHIWCCKHNEFLYLDSTKTDYKFRNGRYIGHCKTFRFSSRLKEEIQYHMDEHGLLKWDKIIAESELYIRNYPNRKARIQYGLNICEWCNQPLEIDSWVRFTKRNQTNHMIRRHILHKTCYEWIEQHIQQLKDECAKVEKEKFYRYYRLPNGFELIVNHSPIERGF